MSSLSFDPKSIQIIASDLDGTLLLPDHTLGEFTKKTLRQLHEQGFTFVFATGRHSVDVASMRETLGIPAYMITANGARVHTPDNQVLSSRNISPSVVQPIVDFLKQDSDHRIHLYRSDDWLTSKDDLAIRDYQKQTGFIYQLFDLNNAPTEDIAKIFVAHPDHEHLAQYESQLKEKFGDKLSIAFSTPQCLEMMALNTSKGAALETVATHLGKTLDHCIAFGDGMNDVEMLTAAHKGLVMGTSHIKVKQALPNHEVIGNCQDEAVAQFLETHLL